MRTHALLSLALLTALGGALAGCGEEPVPDTVSYVKDIQPLLEARCIRCHGAGGTENDDPAIAPIANFRTPHSDFRSLNGYLAPDGTTMITGLMTYTGAAGVVTMKTYVEQFGMPPPPAPKLTSREHDMLLKWCANPHFP